MNVILLATLCLTEVIFTAVNIAKHSDSTHFRKARLIVDCGEMLIFLASLLTPEVKFGIRFTGLFILLAVRLLLALIAFLAGRRKEPKEKSAARLIVRTVFICTLFASALIPSFIFADYNGLPMSGEYEVNTVKAILVDDSRTEQFESDGSKREVPVYFYYPETDGTQIFPLLVFSHGAFGYYQSNTSTYMELASNGYIVVSTEHPYHSIFTTDTDGKKIIADGKFLNDVIAVDNFSEEEIFEMSSQWIKLRTDDVNFVLDTIERACSDSDLDASWHCDDAQNVSKVLKMCDCSKVGLMGHSLGGATAVTLGRTRDEVAAVIDFDGTMLGEITGVISGTDIINEEEYPLPLLSFNNESHQKEIDEYKASGKTYANTVVIGNAKESFETYFVGTEHMDFTDLPMFSPFLGSLLGTGTADTEKCVMKMNEITLRFFDSYIKNEGEFTVEDHYEFSELETQRQENQKG